MQGAAWPGQELDGARASARIPQCALDQVCFLLFEEEEETAVLLFSRSLGFAIGKTNFKVFLFAWLSLVVSSSSLRESLWRFPSCVVETGTAPNACNAESQSW